jgi:isoamylase
MERSGCARALAFTLAGIEQEPDIHVMMNMYWQPLEFELPAITGRCWFRAVDTALLQPNDFSDPGTEFSISGSAYLASARSVAVLVSK